ncbi:MBL fold metallo-hydrolase [Rhodococcus sp. KBS0724]|uniref:MBL fold metallo-hydrolase n=1 Tax=Rhodococcus sp. KBS0724 TaxID=1179674 RepID=UPI00110D59B6|nr:MBL fold metallo-hydrolase [Rhodococcus sp. KBS0724]TSD47125.1 MBL fold metallo-hydrolase [Rhodococcus sp. KBS0724]
MLVTGFPAGMFQTNCYILAQDDACECVVIDPGQDAAEPLFEFLDSKDMSVTAVLLTHGHLDHMWSAREVCERYSAPAYIHPDDRYMLTDPARGIGPTMKDFIKDMSFVEPDEVIELSDGDSFELAGMSFAVDHTPGHTQGSVVFRTRAGTAEGPVDLAFTGDTLFQGSIGRSDLPGGNHEQLLDSVARKLLILDDATVILPGHGDNSSIGAERSSNPFLVGLSGQK